MGSAIAAPQNIGKGAADQYFKQRQKEGESRVRRPSSSKPRYMALHLGGYVNEDTYKWGERGNNDVGQLMGGVTYRVGEWKESMDLLFRADISSFEVDDANPVKLSLLPLVTFPDARSQFPLYFGAGAGIGVFFKQARGESSLSFDYQVVAGGRFFDVFDNVGLMFEAGVKNSILLFSDGQHNGVFTAVGTVFRF
ncbi:MAG: hypothetical protein KDD61_15135 [Bdellovibrionales bacterium]|nr:hypothetical protein [Bdellovibrionales bacterium]